MGRDELNEEYLKKLQAWAKRGGSSDRPPKRKKRHGPGRKGKKSKGTSGDHDAKEIAEMFREAPPLPSNSRHPSRVGRKKGAPKTSSGRNSGKQKQHGKSPRGGTPGERPGPKDIVVIRRREIPAPAPKKSPAKAKGPNRKRKHTDPNTRGLMGGGKDWEFPPGWHTDLEGVPHGSVTRPDDFGGMLRPWEDGMEAFSVGIDAGTSGIRLAATHEYSGELRIFDFGENRAGGTRFSFPALVGIRPDGRLVFGNEAVDVDWEQRFTSFKAGILYPEQALGTCRRWEVMRLPYGQSFADELGPSVPDFLYAISVARALTIGLPQLLDGFQDCFLTFSVGAPLDGTDGTRRRYARAFSSGVLLAGAIPSDPEIGDLVECFATAWRDSRGPARASENERRVHVRHEAQLSTRPLEPVMTEGRNFLVADIGATTTEISLLRKEPGAIRRWASMSSPAGVDRLDLVALEKAQKGGDLLRRRIARLKRLPGKRSPGMPELLNDLRKAVRSVMYQAVAKNPDRPSWSTLHVAVAGGGSNISHLRDSLLEGGSPHAWVERRILHPLDLDGDVSVRGASEAAIDAGEVAELLCVLGAASSPDEDQEYEEQEPDTVVPTYEDPLRELTRATRARWL